MAIPPPQSMINLQPWKPGQSGNPGGKQRLSPELKAIAALSRLELARIVAKYARMNMDEFTRAWNCKDTPILELAIIAILRKAGNGDHLPLAWLIDRALGKAQEQGPEEVEMERISKQLEGLTDAQLIELTKKKLAEFEAGK